MATPEALTKAAIKRAVKLLEVSSGGTIPSMMPIPGDGNAGAPDVWLMVCGNLVLVEAKADAAEGGRDATPHQKRFMAEWAQAGAVCFVVRSELTYKAWFTYMCDVLLLDRFEPPPWRSAAARSRPKPPPPKPPPPRPPAPRAY